MTYARVAPPQRLPSRSSSPTSAKSGLVNSQRRVTEAIAYEASGEDLGEGGYLDIPLRPVRIGHGERPEPLECGVEVAPELEGGESLIGWNY